MNYKPLGATVLVRPPKIKDTTESGIIKSEAMLAEEKNKWDGSVEVIAVGPHCQYVKPGIKVLIQHNAIIHPVMVGNEELMQVEEYTILGYYE